MTLIPMPPAVVNPRVRLLLTAMLAVAMVVLAGCATRPKLPEPLRGPSLDSESLIDVIGDKDGASAGVPEERAAGRIVLTPPPSAEPDPGLTAPIRIPSIPNASKPISLVLDGVPLSAFIDVIFATELKFPVTIDRSVRERSDLVSLRIAQPQSAETIYRLAAEVLRNYGVVISESGGMLRFYTAGANASGSNFVVARSAPELPSGARQVFVVVPMKAKPANIAVNQLRSMYAQNPSIKIDEVLGASAIMLSGPADAVREVANALMEIDGAGVREKGSVRIEPQFLSAEVLSKALKEVLVAQGYSVQGASVSEPGVLRFVTMPASNVLMVFSESRPALEATAYWAEALDKPNPNDGIGGAYVYAPKHTTVTSLLPVLSALVMGAPVSSAPSATPGAQPIVASPSGAPQSMGSAVNAGMGANSSTMSQGAQSGATVVAGANGQLVADPVRNLLVFQGDPQRWRAMQSVLARLDVPTRQVVIEVTVAEVTLTDEYSHGVEWALRNIEVNGMSGPVSILQGAAKAEGLVWSALSSSGQVRATLNLFAKDSRINILSTPRIMVKSGERAQIQVGDEVPIITSQATAADLPTQGGNSTILQNVTYRKTGVLLDVQAVVHSSKRVDLTITQEVSQAVTTDTSAISSPTISSRKATTSLTLPDGQSMLLGGLIDSTSTRGKSKVPLLGDIPVVGNLFSTKRNEKKRTELLMLITPYIISSESQGRDLTDAVKTRFETGNQRVRVENLPVALPTPVQQGPVPAVPAPPAPAPVPVPMPSTQQVPSAPPPQGTTPSSTTLAPVIVTPPDPANGGGSGKPS